MEFTKEQKLYHQIVKKAWEDADFKRELTENPLAAVEKLTGVKLNIPEGKKIVVRDQSNPSTTYINIPHAQQTDDVELNEEQLETVAGGSYVSLPIDIICPIFPPYDTMPIDPIIF
ncbi:NHLP leader peptide family natural product precursor [Kordia sp. TARA_039_SRF]|nr:NHLP leader peptide family natural product precursor [Kordia sp. TARA_039_SRF]